MYKLFILSLIASIILFSGCEKDNNVATVQEFNFSFQSDPEGWIGDFADYLSGTPEHESIYEMQFSHAMLPNPLNTNDGALRQSGNNRSDDLFMFVKKKITGLELNRNYTISIEIEIATNAPSGRVGSGGIPGEGVAIKAGASTIEPVKVIDNTDNHYRMNVDKGNQSNDGPTIKLIGDFANGTNSEDYRLKRLSTSSPVNVQSNANGELWLIVGTDSGYEGTTTIYYNYIKAALR